MAHNLQLDPFKLYTTQHHKARHPMLRSDLIPIIAACIFSINTCIASDVVVVSPLDGDILRGGVDFLVQWTSKTEIQSLSISYLRDPLPDSERLPIAAQLSGTQGAVPWKVPRDMTTTGTLIFEHVDQGTTRVVKCERLTVDSIRPTAKIKAPESTLSTFVPLAIEIRDVGPAKLRSAKLWYSSDDGASWKEDVKLDVKPGEPAWNSPTPEGYLWKAPAPGEYLLYIVAEDFAGNAMPEPKGKMGSRCHVLVSP